MLLSRFLPLSILSLLLIGCGRVELVNDLGQEQAMTIVAQLQDRGVQVHKVLDEETKLWSITVGKGDYEHSTRLIEELGLLDEKGMTFEQCMKAGPLFAGPVYEQQCRITGLKSDIVQNLTSVPGVVGASIVLVIPEKSFSQPSGSREKAKASVVVEYQSSGQVVPISEKEVAEMVAHSVEGLSAANVNAMLHASAVITQSVPRYEHDLVSFAGVRVDRTSVGQLKLMALITVVLLAVLGMLLFLGGRANDELRMQVVVLERQAKALRQRNPGVGAIAGLSVDSAEALAAELEG